VDSAKMLFLSIPFDKGWKVKVDGKQTDVQLINIGFLGVFLERGQHSIELNYFPDYLWYSIGVSIFFSLIFIVLVFISKELNIKVRLIFISLLAVSGLFYLFFN
jgi:uncharacterized membrane protein YfhO